MEKLLAKIESFHENELFRNILPLTKQILSQEKDNEAALFYHAFALFQVGQYRRSLQYWKRLEAIKPDHFNLHLNMGVCYARLDDYKRANLNYKKELKLYPVSEKSLFNLGTNYYQAHKYKLAAHYLERCYSQNYAIQDIVYKLAYAYFKTDQLEKEQLLYEGYLLKYPNDTLALNNLGAHLMGQGEYHRALLRLKKAERLDSADLRVKRNILKAEKSLAELKEKL